MSGSGGVDITPYEPRHLGPLVDFYRDIWDPRATAESVSRAREQDAARNPATPGEEAPTWLFVKDGVILGHLTTIPIRLWANGVDRVAHWFIGFMVRPEQRNGPIGFLLLREAVKHLEVTLSLTVLRTTRRLFKSLGFTELGVLPNYVRPLRAANLLANLDLTALGLTSLPGVVRQGIRIAQLPGVSHFAGFAGQGAIGAWSAVHEPWVRKVKLTTSGPLDRAALDGLWRSVRTRLPWSPVRDGSYLSWRYDVGGTAPYRAAMAHDGSDLVGIAIVRGPRAEGDPRLRGIKVATLSELVVDPARREVVSTLLRGAEHVGRDFGADALVCSVSHRAAAPSLRRRGYARLPGNLCFLARDAKGVIPGPSTLEDWWLTRGDMNADITF